MSDQQQHNELQSGASAAEGRTLAERLKAHVADFGCMHYTEWEDEACDLLEEAAAALVLRPSPDGPLDPDPSCKRCKGTGEEPNAQFRCACRWRGTTMPADKRELLDEIQ